MEIPFIDYSPTMQGISIQSQATQATGQADRMKISHQLSALRRGQEVVNTGFGIVQGSLNVASAAYNILEGFNDLKGSREVQKALTAYKDDMQAYSVAGAMKTETTYIQDPDDPTKQIPITKFRAPDQLVQSVDQKADELTKSLSATPEIAAKWSSALKEGFEREEDVAQTVAYQAYETARGKLQAEELQEAVTAEANGTAGAIERAIAGFSNLSQKQVELLRTQTAFDLRYQKTVIEGRASAAESGIDAALSAINARKDLGEPEKANAKVAVYEAFRQEVSAATDSAISAYSSQMEAGGVAAGDVVKTIAAPMKPGIRRPVVEALQNKQAQDAHDIVMKDFADRQKVGGDRASAARETLSKITKGGPLAAHYDALGVEDDTGIGQAQRERDIAYLTGIAESGVEASASTARKSAMNTLEGMINNYNTGAGPESAASIFAYARANGLEAEVSTFLKDAMSKVSPFLKPAYESYERQIANDTRIKKEDRERFMAGLQETALNISRDGTVKTVSEFTEMMKDQTEAMIALRIGTSGFKPVESLAGSLTVSQLSAGYEVMKAKGIRNYLAQVESGLDLVVTNQINGQRSFISPEARLMSETAAQILGTATASAVGSTPSATFKVDPKDPMSETKPRWTSYYEPKDGGKDVSSRIIFKDNQSGREYTWKPAGKNEVQLYVKKDSGWVPQGEKKPAGFMESFKFPGVAPSIAPDYDAINAGGL